MPRYLCFGFLEVRPGVGRAATPSDRDYPTDPNRRFFLGLYQWIKFQDAILFLP